jgi:hypothetical protein
MNSLNRGLVMHLALDDIREGQVIDLSGNDHNGTVNGDPQLVVDDIFGQTLSFDGTDDFVDPDALFESIVDTFTIEGWARPSETHEIDSEATSGTSGTSGQKYMLWPTHGSAAYGEGHAAAGISVGQNGVSVYEHAANYMPTLLVWEGNVTEWTHIAVVYKNKQPTLYINAQPVKTGQPSPKIVHPGGQVGGIGDGS